MITKPPYYLFDKKKFCSMIQEYQKYGKIYFPIKANDDNLIVSTIKEQNCCFEVDSIEHIKLLIDKYNVSPEKLLYSYPIRESDDIKTAIDMGVRLFVVDSVDEYKKIISISSDVSIVIRINVLRILDDSILPEQDKWGMDLSEAKTLIKELMANSISVVGISFYIAAEVEQEKAFETVLETLVANFSDICVDFINIGGGISIEKLKDISNSLDVAKTALNAKYIILEPGRHLLNPCIDMVVRVTSIRYINGNRLVFINAGIYNGLIDVIVKNKKYNIVDKCQNEDSNLCVSYVCGSSSDVSDTLGVYKLRDSLSIGDLLYIQECGAYSSVLQTRFYGKLQPQVVLKESI